MRFLSRLLAFLVAVLLGTSVAAAEPLWQGPTGDKAVIQNVIAAQVEAFRRDDGSGAYALASPAIQKQFGDAGTFLRMVREGYAAIIRPRSVEYRRTLEVQGLILQEVFFVGGDLTTLLLLYNMERQQDGSWRINGLFRADSPKRAT